MLDFPADPQPAVLLISQRVGLSVDQVWAELRAQGVVGAIATDSLSDTLPVDVALLPDRRVLVLSDRGPEPGPRPEQFTETLATRLNTRVSLVLDDKELAAHGDPGPLDPSPSGQRCAVMLVRGESVGAEGLSHDLSSPLTAVRLGRDLVVVPDRADHDSGFWMTRSRPVLALDLRSELLVVSAFLPDDLTGKGPRKVNLWSRAGWTWCWGADLRPITDPARLARQSPEHADYIWSMEQFLGAADRSDPALTALMAESLGRAYQVDRSRIDRLSQLLSSPRSGPTVVAQLTELLQVAPEVPALLLGRLDARRLQGAERGEMATGTSSFAAAVLYSVRADSVLGRWIRLVARFPALLLIWAALAVTGSVLLLTDTVDSQTWVALLWVVVGWSVLQLLFEFALMRQVRRERRFWETFGSG